MKRIKTLLLCLFALCSMPFVLQAAAPSISKVAASQRYPWNDLVDIAYEIDGIADPATSSIRVDILDRTTGRVYENVGLEETPPLTPGAHRVSWDPTKLGWKGEIEGLVCKLSLLSYPATMEIDLSGGPSATAYPVAFQSAAGLPADAKTEKLVLRHVPAGTFRMGSPADEIGRADNEDLHEVTISTPFYIGVFEVTRQQWSNVMTGIGLDSVDATRPVSDASYHDLRGASHDIGWPSYTKVRPDGFLGKLRSRTGNETIDLPTEAEWEYACRAGTQTALNNGKDLLAPAGASAELDEVARYAETDASKIPNGIYAMQNPVGSFLPNAWGLYDMHGNAREWCLDYYSDHLGTAAAVDPPGPALYQSSLRVCRGGGHQSEARNCRSASREGVDDEEKNAMIGFRIVARAPEVAEIVSTATSPAFRLSIATGLRAETRRTILPIAYSDDWAETTKGQPARIIADHSTELSSMTGSGLIDWLPETPGVHFLSHECGATQLDAKVFFLLEAMQGLSYKQKLAIEGIVPSGNPWELVATDYEESVAPTTAPAPVFSQEKASPAQDYSLSASLAFDFPFYGKSYRTVRIRSNGTISFFEGMPKPTVQTASRAKLLEEPMIAALWKPMDLSAGAIRYTLNDPETAAISWEGVYGENPLVPVSVTLVITKGGEISIRYGEGNGLGGLIGLSAGDGAIHQVSSMGTGEALSGQTITFRPQGLPEGLELAQNGTLKGTTSEVGDFVFYAKVKNDKGTPVVQRYPFSVTREDQLVVSSAYGTPIPSIGSHTYLRGDLVTAAVNHLNGIGDKRSRGACIGWRGTGSVPATGYGTNVTFRFLEPSSIEWIWGTEHLLEIEVIGDGVVSQSTRWVREGEKVKLFPTPTGKYAVFSSWGGDLEGMTPIGSGIEVTMDRPRKIQATFETETCEVKIFSEFGNCHPAAGVYRFKRGRETTLAALDHDTGPGTNRHCFGWLGTGSIPPYVYANSTTFVLEEDSTIRWRWITRYKLAISTQGNGGGIEGGAQEDWRDEGDDWVLPIKIKPGYFVVFEGDGEGVVLEEGPGESRVRVPSDRTRRVVVQFVPWTLGAAMNAPDLAWTTSGSSPWTIQNTETVGGDRAAVQSGVLASQEGDSILEVKVTGAGILDFQWKLAPGLPAGCGVSFYIDGEMRSEVPTESWQAFGRTGLNWGEHTLQWRIYSQAPMKGPAVYLDRFVWEPSYTDTPVPVPYTWLYEMGIGFVGEENVTAREPGENGLLVWQSYAMGLDPTNSNSLLRASIRVDHGFAKVTWSPDLRPKRTYRLFGKEDLLDKVWTECSPYDEYAMRTFRFFKVEIDLPPPPED